MSNISSVISHEFWVYKLVVSHVQINLELFEVTLKTMVLPVYVPVSSITGFQW